MNDVHMGYCCSKVWQRFVHKIIGQEDRETAPSYDFGPSCTLAVPRHQLGSAAEKQTDPSKFQQSDQPAATTHQNILAAKLLEQAYIRNAVGLIDSQMAKAKYSVLCKLSKVKF